MVPTNFSTVALSERKRYSRYRLSFRGAVADKGRNVAEIQNMVHGSHVRVYRVGACKQVAFLTAWDATKQALAAAISRGNQVATVTLRARPRSPRGFRRVPREESNVFTFAPGGMHAHVHSAWHKKENRIGG